MHPILVVDDSHTVLLGVCGLLESAGWKSISARSGQDALTHLGGMRFSLMITDLNMPGMDGIGLIREARKLPACRFMPILMLTTESQQGKRDEARSVGATGWLVKPVGATDLMLVVRKVVPGA